MTARTDPGSSSSALVGRARGFWAYYRRYTTTAIHAAATATMTAFGLLLFIDPWFALLAIAAYVLPPVILYLTGHDAGDSDAERPGNGVRTRDPRHPDVDADGSDADSDGIDADSDGPDLDHDGPDHDHDGIDRDHDGIDRDSDGTDVDVDGSDGDSDGLDVDRDGPDLDRDG